MLQTYYQHVHEYVRNNEVKKNSTISVLWDYYNDPLISQLFLYGCYRSSYQFQNGEVKKSEAF